MDKIAILTPNMIVGGAERSMAKLAIGFHKRGVPVDLVMAKAYGEFLHEIPTTFSIIDLKASRTLTSLLPLVRYLRRARPKAILSILQMNYVAIWAGKLAATKTRIFVSERTNLSHEVQQHKYDIRLLMMPKLAAVFYPWADGVIAVSHGVATDLVRTAGLSGKKIFVIYNPIITEEFVRKTQEPIVSPIFSPDHPPVIIGVGRLTAQKDFSTLIRAFSKILQNRDAHLLIIGEGEERSLLETLVSELGISAKVSMPGFIANPYPYMMRSAVFVLSSRWEGLPGVLIEAMYCGIPLVATNCPSGSDEILADGRYGQLVPVGDVNAMALAINRALDRDCPLPLPEGWWPYQEEKIVSQYVDLLLG